MSDLFGGYIDEPAAGITPVPKKKPPRKKKTDAPAPKPVSNLNKFKLAAPVLPVPQDPSTNKADISANDAQDTSTNKADISAKPVVINKQAPQDTDRGNLKRATEIFKMFGLIHDS